MTGMSFSPVSRKCFLGVFMGSVSLLGSIRQNTCSKTCNSANSASCTATDETTVCTRHDF